MKICKLSSNFEMNMHSRGILPVYSDRRYRRGGGILSSIACIVLPTAKKMLLETVKAAPKVIDSIVNEKQSQKSAFLRGIKTASANTVPNTFNRMGVRRSQSYAGRKRRHPKQVQRQKRLSKCRKQNIDIFS